MSESMYTAERRAYFLASLEYGVNPLVRDTADDEQ